MITKIIACADIHIPAFKGLDDLKEILEAATNAPSGMNLQSPKILVIQRKEIIERLGVWNKSFYPETFARKLSY